MSLQDEIPDWITPPHAQDQRKVIKGFRLILEGLGLDLDDPHLKETPQRAARAWWFDLNEGITGPEPKITTFPSTTDQMILLRNIPIHSYCAHHLLPFVGTATIGYVPGNGQILGISKLSRIANFFSRRPQVQEELTEQIANAIMVLVMKKPEPRPDIEDASLTIDEHQQAVREKIWPEGAEGGVGVVIRASHMCMTLRGVKHEGDMVTSALRGVFLSKPEARAEFLQMAGGI